MEPGLNKLVKEAERTNTQVGQQMSSLANAAKGRNLQANASDQSPLGIDSSWDLSQGGLMETGNSTDLSLIGKGWFVLFDDSGNFYVSRNGQFSFNNKGELTNEDGLFVASFDPGTSTLNKTDKSTLGGLGSAGDTVHFSSDGILVNDTRGDTGRQLAIGIIPNEQGLKASHLKASILKLGGAAGTLSVAPAGTNGLGFIKPGFLELAASNPVAAQLNLGFLQRHFTSTVSAMKDLMKAVDAVIAAVKAA